MKTTLTLVAALFFGFGCMQNTEAQLLGKLKKKAEKKVEKAIDAKPDTKKSVPQKPSVTKPTTTSKTTASKTSSTTKGNASQSIGHKEGKGEEGCKNTESYFKLARKDLAKIMTPEPDSEPLAIAEMEGILKRVESQWLEKIKTRDPNCDTSALENEMDEAQSAIDEKKTNSSYLPIGKYECTGVWDELVFGTSSFERYSNKQDFEIKGTLGTYKGQLKYKADGPMPESVGVNFEGLGQAVIVPKKDDKGNVEYHQLAFIQGDKPVAVVFFSNKKSKADLQELMSKRSMEKLDRADLDPFTRKNLGKFLVSTQGPIYANGKIDGKDNSDNIKFINSFILGQDVWLRMFNKDNRTMMEHLMLTGFPPAGKGGGAIKTELYFNGELVGKDFLRATKGDDAEATNTWKHYREPFFESKGDAQDAFREGIEGIFAKNPSYGEHDFRIKRYIVNYNVMGSEKKEDFPLQIEIADSGPLKMKITAESWRVLCNTGGSNYGPVQGSKNNLANQLLAAIKREASRSNWKETPKSAVHTKSTKIYHELTGNYMYTIHEGYVISSMPNGSRIEQGFQMVDGSYHATISGTQRYLPPKCN
ncbi:hypothetical protein [Flagellimonas flava]|uniref:Uncharacterized protein n=1 Tax=Flagellimonas flava TaxID=570519 RepID=A0A1M5KK51_9FLAO|nr:hypothetical protein [Allomuricauda flava]SHG53222.1 hypothetical protein SAMN04488116_1636 [Allomuricauda flava]